MKYSYAELAKMIDHSLLHPTVTDQELELERDRSRAVLSSIPTDLMYAAMMESFDCISTVLLTSSEGGGGASSELGVKAQLAKPVRRDELVGALARAGAITVVGPSDGELGEALRERGLFLDRGQECHFGLFDRRRERL